jgi:hypothetical protein
MYDRMAKIVSELCAELDALPPTEETRKLKMVYRNWENFLAAKADESRSNPLKNPKDEL